MNIFKVLEILEIRNFVVEDEKKIRSLVKINDI